MTIRGMRPKKKKTRFRRALGRTVFYSPARFLIRKTSEVLSAHAKRILRPNKFQGFFKANEKVLLIHADISDARELIEAIRELAGQFDALKMQGFSGIYGDTQNQSVERQFIELGEKNKLDWQVFETPPLEAIISKARYLLMGHPKKHAKNRPQRICIRFKD